MPSEQEPREHAREIVRQQREQDRHHIRRNRLFVQGRIGVTPGAIVAVVHITVYTGLAALRKKISGPQRMLPLSRTIVVEILIGSSVAAAAVAPTLAATHVTPQSMHDRS